MSKHLNEELGARYVNEMFHRAIFTHDGKVCMVRMVEAGSVHVDSFVLADEKAQWQRDVYPPEVLKDFSAFAYPTLGYREFDSGFGKFVTFISSKRSAHRGLRDESILSQPLPVFQTLGMAINETFVEMAPAQRLRAVFAPKFTDFKTGIKQLFKGEIAGFAVNEQLAVGLATSAQERPFEVYFRQRVVGHIDEKGSLTLSNKVINRPSLRKALE